MNITNNIKIKKIIILVLLGLCTFILPACDDVQIFKKKVDPYALVPVKDKNLEKEIYYVKDNTNFYMVHKPEGSARDGVDVLKESRVFMPTKDFSLIPPLYKDEIIGFKTEKIEDLPAINLERFEDLGYSFGCYNCTYLEDKQMVYFDYAQGLAKSSSLAWAIGEQQSKDLRIATINDKSIQKEDIDMQSGTIIGLEQGKTYKVGYYVGSEYHEKSVVADTKILKAYEIFYYNSQYIHDTPNGYFSFAMPNDLKSGYYNINGAGLFKYYAFNRGDAKETEADMNESYYKNERNKIEAYSRQYNVNVPKRVKDFKVTVQYSASTSDIEDVISGIAFAPDDTRFDMDIDTENKEIILSMAEAMAGDWTINVIPKTLNIEDVRVDSDKTAQETTCEETVLSLPEDRENVEFIAEVVPFETASSRTEQKKYTVSGVILSEDGSTYELNFWKDDRDNQNIKYYMKYEIPYVKAGQYIVRIYHYPEETTIGPVILQDVTETSTEVIVIEG